MKSTLLGATVLLLSTSAQTQNNVILETPEFKPPVVTTIQEVPPAKPRILPGFTENPSDTVIPEAPPQLAEPLRTNIIQGYMKFCINGWGSRPASQKTYSQQEIENFCACSSVKLANRTTKLHYAIRQVEGEYPQDWWVIREEVKIYCMTTYMNLPSVEGIKNKKW